MINFVTTRSHRYTLRRLVAEFGARQCRLWSYETLFTKKRLPGGTWVFTDHERLSVSELLLAARIANLLDQKVAPGYSTIQRACGDATTC